MPGIAGIIHHPAGPDRPDEVSRMVQSMVGADANSSGQLAVAQSGVHAGWVARSGSFADRMPVWNTTRTICLIFTGEDFPAASSGLAGVVASLVDRYEKHGAKFFAQLNGWFSGLLIDLRTHRAILFNDRYGLNRLYYHESQEGFYFGSEAKSLLAVLPSLRQIDQRGLAEVFSAGCVLQNRSIFSGIFLLPPGSQWIFHADGRIDKTRYFDPSAWEQQEKLDPAGYTEQLIEVFGRITPRYLSGPEPVAMSLTGGLDSRMLLAWSGASPRTLPCYSFSGPYRDCADVTIARRLAEVAQQLHSTLRIEKDFFQDFPSLAAETVRISDGSMDVSGAIELYVNRKARQIAPVRLTGNYGSEILRSNVAFQPRRLDPSSFTPEFNELLQQAADTYRQEAAGHRLSFIAFKQVPWHHYPRHSIERSQVTPRAPFLDNELVALAYRAPTRLATSPQPLLELIAAGNPRLESVPTDRMLQRGKPSLVAKLRQQWQEFTAKAEYAYDYGMPRRLVQADHILSRLHLERLFLGRHKFYHYRIWYQNQLSDYLRTRISTGSPSCYRDGAVAQMINEHLGGRSNRTLELHRMLTVQLIDQSLIRPR